MATRLASKAVGLQRVLTKLTYPRRPPQGLQGGRVVTPTHWQKIGGIFPTEAWTGDMGQLNDEEEVVEVPVTDARTLPAPPTLSRNGFELWTTRPPSADLYDDAAVKESYYEQTARLVEEATGASQCWVFQHMRRDSSMHNKECNGAGAKAHGAVARVHADYTPSNGPQKLSELEAAGLVPRGVAEGRRWAIVNVWRSLDAEHAIEEKPLAVLDASTVAHDSTFTYALITDGPPALVGFNNSVGFAPAHEWYYFPKMKADEALLFYTYDGSAEPPRFVFHSAIDVQADAERGGSVRPRRSIECRCLAVW